MSFELVATRTELGDRYLTRSDADVPARQTELFVPRSDTAWKLLSPTKRDVCKRAIEDGSGVSRNP